MATDGARKQLFPEASAAGIVENFNGERVVPTSRRADGSTRKEIRIRPGYTPTEDVSKFRSARMLEHEAREQNKKQGGVVGMALSEQKKREESVKQGIGKSKAQKKNEARRKKRAEGKADGGEEEEVPDDWDADEGEADSKEEGEKEDTVPSTPARSTAAIPPPPTPSAAAVPAPPPPTPATPALGSDAARVRRPERPSRGPGALLASALAAAKADAPPRPSSSTKPAPSDSPAKPTSSAKPTSMHASSAEDSSKTEDPERLIKAIQKKIRQAEQLRDRRTNGETLLAEQQAKVDGIAGLEDELKKLSVTGTKS